jgi:hypothetical protein
MNPSGKGRCVVRGLDSFRDQVFYAEACRLRDEQRSRMELRDRPSNVVSIEQYRQQRREHR